MIQYLIVGLESIAAESVIEPLDNVAGPLESLPAEPVKVNESQRAVPDIAGEIELLRIAQINVSEPDGSGDSHRPIKDAMHRYLK
jgi:hypothetical protein